VQRGSRDRQARASTARGSTGAQAAAHRRARLAQRRRARAPRPRPSRAARQSRPRGAAARAPRPPRAPAAAARTPPARRRRARLCWGPCLDQARQRTLRLAGITHCTGAACCIAGTQRSAAARQCWQGSGLAGRPQLPRQATGQHSQLPAHLALGLRGRPLRQAARLCADAVVAVAPGAACGAGRAARRSPQRRRPAGTQWGHWFRVRRCKACRACRGGTNRAGSVSVAKQVSVVNGQHCFTQ